MELRFNGDTGAVRLPTKGPIAAPSDGGASPNSNTLHIVGLIAFDSFDQYTIGDEVNKLNKGWGWLGSYFDEVGNLFTQRYDSFEQYPTNVSISGKAGGYNWSGAWQ